MAVDYLKTYLGIDPDDYSAMEARIRGEEPQAQAPVMMRQPMMMPQRRSLSDIEAMPSMPRVQIQPQEDDRYQSLMDEIASLKAQIEGLQAPTEQAPVMAEQAATEQAPVMVDEPTEVNMEDVREMFYQSPEFKDYQERTKGMAHDMAYRPQTYTDPVTGKTVSFQDRSGLFQDWYKKTYGRDLSISSPYKNTLPSLSDALKTEPYQAPPELQNRMVDEPQKLPPAPPPTRVIHRGPTGSVEIYDDNLRPPEPDMSDKFSIKRTTQAPSQDIQSSIDYLAKLPKMNIPQIPDIEQIRQKMEEANMTFPEPVSYQDQLQSIRDLLAMNQMPQQMPQPMQELRAGEIMPNSPVVDTRSFPRIPGPLAVPPGIIPNLVKKQVQQPQMQSVGRPQLPFQGGFMPEMRADGGGIDKAIYDLKFKLNG